jgi:hypothetical protein
MKVRLWNRKTDYETILGWWGGHAHPDYILPSHLLPPSGWIVVDDDDTPLCITWLYYFQHTPGALLGNIVSNPDAPAEDRAKAFDLLMLRVTTEADKNNAQTIIGITTRPGVVRKAKKFGFRQTTEFSVEFQRDRGTP